MLMIRSRRLLPKAATLPRVIHAAARRRAHGRRRRQALRCSRRPICNIKPSDRQDRAQQRPQPAISSRSDRHPSPPKPLRPFDSWPVIAGTDRSLRRPLDAAPLGLRHRISLIGWLRGCHAPGGDVWHKASSYALNPVPFQVLLARGLRHGAGRWMIPAGIRIAREVLGRSTNLRVTACCCVRLVHEAVITL